MLTAQIFPFGTEYKDRQNMPNGTHNGGSARPRNPGPITLRETGALALHNPIESELAVDDASRWACRAARCVWRCCHRRAVSCPALLCLRRCLALVTVGL